jgi:thioredoxin-dependent peroxiredoxin
MKIKIGDVIPSFESTNEKGELVSSESLKGTKTILFFYPKDDTPGCTKEACSLRDNYAKFKQHGFHILGVSPDNEKKHKNFIEKFEFPFSLIADPDKKILNAFGLYGPKKFMGKDVMGVYRTTVVTDEHNIITHIIEKVRTDDHADQIAEVLGF